MVASVDAGKVELNLHARPNGTPVLTASATSLDPFRNIERPADLWIRWETFHDDDSIPCRCEFVTRRRPYRGGATPKTIAGRAWIVRANWRLLDLLAIQMVVDFIVAQAPSADGVSRKELVHLPAFIEPPSYDWNRYEALCAQFEAERSTKRRVRRSTGDRGVERAP